MEEVRPALAQRLRQAPDEHAPYRYDEASQFSMWNDGSPVVETVAGETGTFAEPDQPQPATDTRAERDPGDLADAALAQRRGLLRLASTDVRKDRVEPATVTKAVRDPGDVMDATIAGRVCLRREIFTEAERDRDEPAEPDDGSSDDLVTGIVAF